MKRILGTEGDDNYLNGGLYGTDKDEIIEGLAGNDYIIGGGGNDWLFGGNGGDLIQDDDGDDFIIGGKGDDLLSNLNGNDTFFWDLGDGNDRIGSGSGLTIRDPSDTDVLQFGAGITVNDIEVWNAFGALEMYIGEEKIWIESFFDPDYTIELRFDNGDVLGLSDVEAITTTPGRDYIDSYWLTTKVLRGYDGDDFLKAGSPNGGNYTLYGNEGDDRLYGSRDNDTLIGGSGADIMKGGEGVDRASYVDATSGVRVDMSNMSTNTGDAQGDTFESIEEMRGSAFDDVLIGDAGDNGIFSSSGNDKIFGASGNDHMHAGAGNDQVYGNAGDDRLNTGTGIDYVVGGEGNDTFVFRGTDLGFNKVADFTTGEDKIAIYADTGIADFAELVAQTSAHASTGDALITLDDGGKTLLVGVDQNDLSASDFAFL